MHHPNALDKFSSHRVLEQKAPGTRFQCFKRLHISLVSREHNDSCSGEFPADLRRHVDSTPIGELDVHQHGVETPGGRRPSLR
jgi:hypothetical protein